MTGSGTRLLGTLPGIYRVDSSGDLRALLSVFEQILLGSAQENAPGIEEHIDAIPSLFAPLEVVGDDSGRRRQAPERFLPWLAEWVAFSPSRLFTPQQLRRIVAGIVPLYGRRGTRGYLETLLRLCFEEINAVDIDEYPLQGLVIGRARVGEDTLLAIDRPFWFRVLVDAELPEESPKIGPESLTAFEYRVRAIIDFAKPAHTAYELKLRYRNMQERRQSLVRKRRTGTLVD